MTTAEIVQQLTINSRLPKLSAGSGPDQQSSSTVM